MPTNLYASGQVKPTKNWIAICSLTAVVINIFNFCLIVLLYGNNSRLAAKPPPTLVQLTGGKTVKVKAIGSTERTPDTIKKFTLRLFSLMMTWTGYLPDKSNESNLTVKDPGVIIQEFQGQKDKLPTPAWSSSFALSADFRRQFLTYLAQMTPSAVFSDRIDVIFVPLNIQEPIPISPGNWQVNLVADLLIVEATGKQKTISFNKKIFLRAVEQPIYEGIPKSKNNNSYITELVTDIRGAGLEVYLIEDLD